MVAKELSEVRQKKACLSSLGVAVQKLLVEKFQEDGHALLPALGVEGGWDTCDTDTFHLLLTLATHHGKVCVHAHLCVCVCPIL